MKKQLIILSILILMSIVTVSSEKINTPLDINIQCSNSTYANITYIKYTSDSTYLLNKTNSMDLVSTDNYRYTITQINNNRTGEIEYGYKCDLNGLSNSFGNRLSVSLMGETISTSQGTLYVVLIIGLLIILGLTFYGAMIFPWKNNRNEEGNIVGINDLKYVKVILWVFVYLEIMFIVTILKNLSGYLMSDGIYYFFNLIFWIMLSCLVPFFPLLIFYTLVIWLDDKKTQKKLKRGVFVT